MTHYTLHELAKLTGIQTATIRVWERRYDIIKPKRSTTNRRWYDDNDLKRLINISIIYQSGVKISRIASYSESQLVENVESLTKDSSISDIHIRALIPASLSFNPNAVSEILLRATINLGFEETFSSVVFPFLRRIGVMWQTGKANTGVEHFITNILRGKLIAAIDSLPPPNDPKRKRALLFLPDNELHEMGLLFYSYLIRKWGHEVLYLGQATPFTALNEAEEKWNPDILVTGGLSELSVYKPEEYLHKLSTTFRSKKILLSGSLADKRRIDKYVNIYPVRSVSNLKTHF